MARMISRQEASELLECSPQTISNWVKNGVITGHNIGKTLMIDRNSITKNFDTAKDVAVMEQKLKTLKSELEFEIKKSEIEMRDLKETLTLKFPKVPKKIYSLFMLSIIKLSKNILSDKELDIITRIVKGNKLETIAKKYGYSNNGILQIGLFATQKIQSYIESNDIVNEIKILREENGRLRSQIENMKMGNEGKEEVISFEKSPFETKINCLKISRRTLDILNSIGCESLGDLVRIDKSTLQKTPQMGTKGMVELDDVLNNLGVKWGMDIDRMNKKDIQRLKEKLNVIL